jgi:hypothetical protein
MVDMTGIVTARIISFVLLTTCAALCQRPDRLIATSALPDAPSAHLPFVQTRIHSRSSGSVHLTGTSIPVTVTGDYPAQFDLTRLEYTEPPTQKDLSVPIAKYLSPSPTSPLNRNHASASDSLVSRATYAASGVVFTHDDSGRSRPNTSYLLRVLTSAVVHSAYRPYWKRSISQPFSEFGATIGNDAGMNVLHEFEPGILQIVKIHQPKFVSEIAEHFHGK